MEPTHRETAASADGSGRSAGRGWRWALGLLRVGIAAALLAFLFRTMDVEEAAALLRAVRLDWLLLSATLIVVIRFVFAWRWKILLARWGVHLGIWSLTRVIFVSMFFGSFMPGVMGSDFVRAYKVSRTHGRLGTVAGSLLADRLLGVYALTVVALVAALVARTEGSAHGFLLPLAGLQVVVLAGWAAGGFFLERLGRLEMLAGTRAGRLWAKLLAIGEMAIGLPKSPGVFLPVLALSVGVVLLRCLVFYTLYRAFGVPVPVSLTFVFVPIVFVIIMVPLSIGGVGIRETALVYLFGTVGVPTEASVAVGLTFQLLQVVCSLPGVPLWLAERRGETRQEAR